MADNPRTGAFGLIIGAVGAVVLVVFIMSGGSKTTIESDKDLPPVADPAHQSNTIR